MIGIPPSSIPWLAMGSWLLCVGWFGFNVMSAQSLKGISGLVAVNSLMAMCGGILAAAIAGDNDPGFVHNGALAGLVAVCAGSDVMHPVGAFITGGVAGVIFVSMFQRTTINWKIDDVLGVWPLHGLCGVWGGVACGIFGLKLFGGLGGVSLAAQTVGTALGAAAGYAAGTVAYWVADTALGLRLGEDDEKQGADLAIHKSARLRRTISRQPDPPGPERGRSKAPRLSSRGPRRYGSWLQSAAGAIHDHPRELQLP